MSRRVLCCFSRLLFARWPWVLADWYVLGVVIFFFLVGVSGARAEYLALYAGPGASQLRPSDELWVISTRQLDATPDEPFVPQVKYLAAPPVDSPETASLRAASLQALLSAPPMWTLVYVHGNRITYDESLQSGWDLYCALVKDSNLPPTRFIIWSWPSDPIHGVLRDVRCKAARADAEAHLLATFLNRLSPETDVALVGYSFGTRVIAGGVHLISGGELMGRRLPETTISERPGPRSLRAALLAAAMRADVMASGEPYSDAVEKFDRVLVLFNSCDPILKHYGWLERCHGRRAMGYTGIEGPLPRENVVWQYDVAHLVGRTHHLWYYFGSDTIVDLIRRYIAPPHFVP